MMLTVKEAAELLKVSKETMYREIKRGNLQWSKVGKQYRISQEKLIEYYKVN